MSSKARVVLVSSSLIAISSAAARMLCTILVLNPWKKPKNPAQSKPIVRPKDVLTLKTQHCVCASEDTHLQSGKCEQSHPLSLCSSCRLQSACSHFGVVTSPPGEGTSPKWLQASPKR